MEWSTNQNIPVSVSALNGEALEVLGIENFSDCVEFLPNVVFQGMVGMISKKPDHSGFATGLDVNIGSTKAAK